MIINKKPVLLVVLIFSGFSVFANHIPVFDNPGLNYQLRSVLMVDYGRLDPYVEFKSGVDGEKGEIDSLDLMAKPGINYFYLKDREPIWNAGLYYSIYFPLNFGKTLVYEHGPYFSFLYHLNRVIKFEFRASYLDWIWTQGKDSIALDDSYTVHEKTMTLGLGILITL